jgi:hypothetical protein
MNKRAEGHNGVSYVSRIWAMFTMEDVGLSALHQLFS